MTIGIYKLKFNTTTEIYVGQSICIEDRFKQHQYKLRNGIHPNYKLQEFFNSHRELPALEIISPCSAEELDTLERMYILNLDSITRGFNITSGGSSGGAGTTNSNSKYTEEDIISCFKMLLDKNNKIKDISKILNISESTISHISNLRQHTWLEDRFPEEYRILRELHASNARSSTSCKTHNYNTLMSPEGIAYKVEHITKFCKMHKLHIGAISRVLKGGLHSYLGWTRKNDND